MGDQQQTVITGRFVQKQWCCLSLTSLQLPVMWTPPCRLGEQALWGGSVEARAQGSQPERSLEAELYP